MSDRDLDRAAGQYMSGAMTRDEFRRIAREHRPNYLGAAHAIADRRKAVADSKATPATSMPFKGVRKEK